MTVHPTVANYRNEEGITVEQEMVFLSPDVEHDSEAVHTFTKEAVQHLKDSVRLR